MPVESPSIFSQVIQDHLELKRRNAELERAMPLGNYRVDDPFNNHPLFKTEQQARLEETMDGTEQVAVASGFWPGEEAIAQPAAEVEADTGLWGRSRDFDWGD